MSGVAFASPLVFLNSLGSIKSINKPNTGLGLVWGVKGVLAVSFSQTPQWPMWKGLIIKFRKRVVFPDQICGDQEQSCVY